MLIRNSVKKFKHRKNIDFRCWKVFFHGLPFGINREVYTHFVIFRKISTLLKWMVTVIEFIIRIGTNDMSIKCQVIIKYILPDGVSTYMLRNALKVKIKRNIIINAYYCMCWRVRVYIYICVCMYVCAGMQVCVCLCVRECACVRVCVGTYVSELII